MVQFLQGITYLSILTFGIAVVVRFIRISRLPLHLRWELYPVAHEGRRSAYGGSVLEESNWWTQPREKSRINELKVMLPEMIFMKGLWDHNRALWYRSFPFHFGLYLLIVTGGLLVVGALGEGLGGLRITASAPLGGLLYYLTMGLGFLGSVLTLLGGIGLLHRRYTDPDLKDFTSPSHIFNLLFIIASVGTLLLAIILSDHDLSWARTYVASLAFSRMEAQLTANSAFPLLSLQVLLLSLLMAYIPLTHMAHFFTKWFTWHKIRWDDEPNREGSWIEKRIQETLSYPVSWSADHIRADGRKSWADIALEEVE